eukprot:CAMPEP_0114379730 /NCGR_PEP_ID=MMETSP0102-20121206/2424_1 /TAXON_ID=38822 ORGANISM="Pteridomonas danica, Strain PT" /NCGR_SAMPLE_ID=MMETSP0102 /ASSEMBLY_ACC=CAM_ASM_000212 /LENGTH=113 /DNA_ID=CAMNT_0001534869 /DNA_START=467 /DNA_END=805 /DNA_ORIENTATION=-
MSDDKNSSQSQEVSVEKVEGVEGEEGDMSPISPPVSLGNSKSYETPVQTNDLRTSTDFYNLYDKLDELKDNEVSGTPENENNNGDEKKKGQMIVIICSNLRKPTVVVLGSYLV